MISKCESAAIPAAMPPSQSSDLGDYLRQEAVLREQAANLNGRICARLGVSFLSGNTHTGGCKTSDDPDVCALLGGDLAWPWTVADDEAKAEYFFERSCKLGNRAGCLFLGTARMGRDEKLGAKFVAKACGEAEGAFDWAPACVLAAIPLYQENPAFAAAKIGLDKCDVDG
ncbi:MAG TPA: hypothetical protein VGY54_22950, partial [Polyangiaceae bacterium]|nr:hypothetical protein [Polyangiaceae bacterium]